MENKVKHQHGDGPMRDEETNYYYRGPQSIFRNIGSMGSMGGMDGKKGRRRSREMPREARNFKATERSMCEQEVCMSVATQGCGYL